MIRNYTYLFAVMLALMTAQGENFIRKRHLYQVEEENDPRQLTVDEAMHNFWEAVERQSEHRTLKAKYEGASGSEDGKKSKGGKKGKSAKSGKKSKRDGKKSKRAQAYDSEDLFEQIMGSNDSSMSYRL